MKLVLKLAVFIGIIASPSASMAFTTDIIQAESPRGVNVPTLVLIPNSPKVGMIMFVGGDGILDLASSSDTVQPNSLLVRIAGRLADNGVLVAIVDLPSGQTKISPKFRISKKHARDIRGVIRGLKAKADVPIWLVGTSSGTFSAASAAIKLKSRVAGLILTSTITRTVGNSNFARRFPEGVNSMNLQLVRIPTLVLGHEADKCRLTPPGNVANLKQSLVNAPRVSVKLLSGGAPDKDGLCKSRSAHGLFGLDREVVDIITTFVNR